MMKAMSMMVDFNKTDKSILAMRDATLYRSGRSSPCSLLVINKQINK
jgi:hypothetical protein